MEPEISYVLHNNIEIGHDVSLTEQLNVTNIHDYSISHHTASPKNGGDLMPAFEMGRHLKPEEPMKKEKLSAAKPVDKMET
jgi:hypothetical protein